MAHRIYRLSVSPEEQPEVQRVFDVDGRSSLHSLHQLISKTFELEAVKPLYAFFMSGRFWDEKTAYIDPRAQGSRADRALLFRAGLTKGKTFAYLLGFETELHFLVTVVSTFEADQPLPAPVLVESVGSYSPSAEVVAAQEAAAPASLDKVLALAEKFLDLHDQVHEDSEQIAAEKLDEPARQALLESGHAALELLEALAGDVVQFQALDEWLLSRSLLARLLDLPLDMQGLGEPELGLAIARALRFADPELVDGDIAVVLARAGRREEALGQVAKNLENAKDACLVETKAGDAYRALGELDAAEAYYRRALALAHSDTERSSPLVNLVSSLMDLGKGEEARQIMAEERARQAAKLALNAAGRNDPCPCGSGKKYKKCHGLRS
jgi:tetratricopeptide (TPR) repeat protein